MTTTYVYALIEAPSDLETTRRRTIRLGGRAIRLMCIAGVGVAFERRDGPPELSEAALRLQHRIVVALARRFDAVLPVRFGAAVDRGELERVIIARRTALQRGFDRVRGREQMTVRIFGEEPATRASAPARSGTEYLRSIRRAAVIPPEGLDVRRAVRDIVEHERVDAGRGRLRATLHHLVPRGAARKYRARIGRALRTPEVVVISGPWPPFAFTPELWP